MCAGDRGNEVASAVRAPDTPGWAAGKTRAGVAWSPYDVPVDVISGPADGTVR